MYYWQIFLRSPPEKNLSLEIKDNIYADLSKQKSSHFIFEVSNSTLGFFFLEGPGFWKIHFLGKLILLNFRIL